jgi:DNA helicase-2/ATP-dependent DNA helicase PcrA
MHPADPLAALLSDLNEPQRQAVAHREGPLLVLAGPGSGKTRVITRRAAHLVYSGVHPSNILAITFTNKAAGEMRARIEALGVARGMWVHTFHALGARLLRELGVAARVEPGFSIYDEDDQLRCIRETLELCQLSPEALRPDYAQAEISRAKNRLWGPADYLARAEGFEQRGAARVYETYEKLLEQRNAVDFDDLLARVAIVLRDHADVADRLRARFRYLLIDEYQDTNHAQYLIARLLAREHRNLCVTGDPDQSIYAWRGADLNNILEFERDYPEARVVRLEQNYRSSGAVLNVASRLIAANRRRKRKDLWTRNPTGQAVRLWKFADGRDEAERIAETIAQACRSGRRPTDFAIFYRINALSRGLEEALRARSLPYRIARGVEFYNRKEIRDTLAYLRLLVNPADRVAIERVINTPPRGIGKTTVERLCRNADDSGRSLFDVMRTADAVPGIRAAALRVRRFVQLVDQMRGLTQASVAGVVGAVLRLSGLEEALRQERDLGGEDRLANVQELVTAATRFEQEADEPTLERFLQQVSLASDQDQVDESAGCVILMTLHTAKGLEFPVVFLAGLEQGLLPHERALHDPNDVEEERRLAFVGITRARQELYLSYADQRLIRGVMLPRAPSQFIYELPEDDVERESFAPSTPRQFEGWSANEPGGRSGTGWREPGGRWRESGDRRGTGGSGRGPRHRPWREREQEPSFTMDDPTLPLARIDPESPFSDWRPGMLVQHDRYGVGEIVSIHPAPGQTRAAIRFAAHGQRTFILEKAPVRRLARETR